MTLSKSRRYTDFLVNEILPSGEVVHLTTLRALKREQKHKPSDGISSAATIKPKPQNQAGPSEQKSDTTKHEPIDQTPERVLIPIKKEEPLTDLEQGSRSINKEANEDGIGQSLPSVKQEQTETDTHLDTTPPKHEPSLPLPNSDVDQPKRISPHQRILATSSPLSINMQDHESKQPETPTRKKTKVLIRQTSSGWVEVDQEQEKELEKKKAEDAGVKRDESPPEDSVKEEPRPDEGKPEPKTSTQAQWQAFASAQPTARGATNFQVIIYH